MRRMTRQFYIRLPSLEARKAILALMLQPQATTPSTAAVAAVTDASQINIDVRALVSMP
jgi:hypothetical protein